jgi:hypothetical protein
MAPGSTWMPTLTAVNQGRTIRGGRRSLIEFWQKAAGGWRLARHVECETDAPNHEGNL